MKELDNHTNIYIYIYIADDGMQITFTPSQPAEKPIKGFVNTDSNEQFKVSTTASNDDIVTAYELALSKCG